MKIPDNAKHFRIARAKELKELATVLSTLGFDQKRRVYGAAQALEDFEYVPNAEEDKNDRNPNYWGYNVEDIIFSFDPISIAIRPKVQNLELNLGICFVADMTAWEEMCDPVKMLTINLVFTGTIQGQSEKQYYAVHIDRHPDKGAKPQEIHPKYHLQFGGKRIPQDIELGNLMLLDPPRIMCFPMELILVIDFILSNFFPEKWERFRDDRKVNTLLRNYQKAILKPYFHCIADHWNSRSTPNNPWSPLSILPNLLERRL